MIENKKQMTRKRLIWADSLKGWLIVLVVLGHAIQYTLGNQCETNHLWNIIYSFHMAAFMAVSGYVAFRPGTDWGGGLYTANDMEKIQTVDNSFSSMVNNTAAFIQ